MEKRIELEKRGKKASDILELNLDNCHSTSVVGLTDEFTNLECLSLINVGLTSLKGFPKLPNLTKLDVSDNRLSTGLNMLTNCPNLFNLNLSGNKIETMEALQPLKELSNLSVLDIYSCPVASDETHKEKVFNMLPSLVYLDGFDKDGKAEEGSDEEEDEEDEDEEELDDEEDDEVGLSYLDKENIDEESEGDDYSPCPADGAFPGKEDEDEDEDEDEEEEDEEEETPRGQKRKLDDTQD